MTTSELLSKIGFTILCVLIPIIWGWAVNWFFSRFSKGKEVAMEDTSPFPDYQI